MDFDIDTSHGIRGVMFSLMAMGIVYCVKEIIKGIWVYRQRNKGPTRNEFQELTKALNAHSEIIKNQKVITEKIAMDLHRYYLFLKVIAVDKWPKYFKAVKELEDEEKNLN
jgi:hypothetical protein